MARIYISSTFEDLKDHREEVARALRRLRRLVVLSMEDYVAADDRPLDKCLDDVAQCDIYVGIFAWRYGFIPLRDNPKSKSITELEYDQANATGKKCLIFLLDPDAEWKPKYADFHTGENESGKRIRDLRNMLEQAHVVSKFKTTTEVALGVLAAVAEELGVGSGDTGVPVRADSAIDPRELKYSVCIAYNPTYDEELALRLSELIGVNLAKKPLLVPEALFAREESGFVKLEETITKCFAAAVLLSPASLAHLKSRVGEVAKILSVMRARLGAVVAVLTGVTSADLPEEWHLASSFEISPAAPVTVASGDLLQWVYGATSGSDQRTVGLPISVLAMTQGEVKELLDNPAIIGEKLRPSMETQFKQHLAGLEESPDLWSQRYGLAREEWRPFGAGGPSVTSIVGQIVSKLNQRESPRGIKVQWYPFDAVKANDPDLRGIYRQVAKVGCILVLDEISLFHPVLENAFFTSSFLTNEQVATVSISPIDPGRTPLNRFLEQETRRKLVTAFHRFADDYDRLCELAIGDERQLKRWLHSALPVTLDSFHEPPPDRSQLKKFREEHFGSRPPRHTGDYAWAGGGT